MGPPGPIRPKQKVLSAFFAPQAPSTEGVFKLKGQRPPTLPALKPGWLKSLPCPVAGCQVGPFPIEGLHALRSLAGDQAHACFETPRRVASLPQEEGAPLPLSRDVDGASLMNRAEAGRKERAERERKEFVQTRRPEGGGGQAQGGGEAEPLDYRRARPRR